MESTVDKPERFNLLSRSSERLEDRQDSNLVLNHPEQLDIEARQDSVEVLMDIEMRMGLHRSMELVSEEIEYKCKQSTRMHRLEESQARRRRTMLSKCSSTRAKFIDLRRILLACLEGMSLIFTLSKAEALKLAIPVLIFDQPLILIIQISYIVN